MSIRIHRYSTDIISGTKGAKLPLATNLLFLVAMTLLLSCDGIDPTGPIEEKIEEAELSVIDGRENAAIKVSEGSNSYYSLEISGKYKSDLSSPESRKGWCIAWNDPISSGNTTHENLRLYTTFGEDHWKPINYLLNIKESLIVEDRELTTYDIQAAIWALLDTPEFNLNAINLSELPSEMVQSGSAKFNKQKVDQIIAQVNSEYKSFQYRDQSTYAVVVKSPSGPEKLIIEVNPYMIEMTDLRDEYGFVVAWDINDQGQIVGGNSIWDEQRGLVDMGSMFAKAINNHGTVVGTIGNETVLWDHTQGSRNMEYNETDTWIEAHDINDSGHVVGEIVREYLLYEDDDYGDVYDYDFSAFIWLQDEEIQKINTDGWANAINNQGQAVGVDYTIPNRAFIWDQQTGPRGLGSYYGYSSGRANAVNNSGRVVGSVLVSGESDNSLFAAAENNDQKSLSREIDRLLQRTRTGGIYDAGHVAEMIKSSAFRSDAFPWREKVSAGKTVSSSSDAALTEFVMNSALSSYQSEAFIWDEGMGMMSLGTLGGSWSTAWDINDQGHVVGYSSYAPGKSHAFFWEEELGMVELPTFGGNSLARAINNEGQIVGYSYDAEGNFYPVLWEVSFTEF